MKYLKLITFLFCIISLNINAQTPKSIEADLYKSYKRIDYWFDKARGTPYMPSADDSLAHANAMFAKKLSYYISKCPFTINQKFSSLANDHLDISTSNDGLFRIYSWDTWTGGTMHFFENVMQYKSGSNFKAFIDTPKSEGDNRPNYYKIYTFKANAKTYYLSIFLFIGSTKDMAEGVHIFTIENGKLADAELIKTHSGLHNELSYDYDFGSVPNMDYEKRPKIYFDVSSNAINLPLIDGDRKMTHKYIVYKFTGRYFERMKN